jgi:hypothetical protein
LRRHTDVDGLDQREAGNERKRLWRRIARAQLHKRAAVEVAIDRDPASALAAPPRLLVQRDEPVAFDGALFRNQVGIGRAGALDDPDARQKIDPAALSVKDPSGPISR